MKIIALSDTHGELPILPKCDVVCICGDISPLHIQNYTHEFKEWIDNEFSDWIKNLKCNKVIITPGNHDKVFERHPEFVKFINESQNKLKILIDEELVIRGVKFYGSPWCPDLIHWAFYGDHNTLVEKFLQIPDDTDVLLTHCPPRVGNAGRVLQNSVFNYGANYGCRELADILEIKQPKWCLCGHIHSGDHNITMLGDTKVQNVSVLDEHYNMTYPYAEINV